MTQYGFGLLPDTETRRLVRLPSRVLENPSSLGEHLKRARQLRGIRQKDVSAMIGVGHFTYMTWEKDQAVPFVRYFPRIVEFVGYDPLPEPQTDGQQLKRERWLMGLTSAERAKQLGIDEGTYGRRETERKRQFKLPKPENTNEI